MTEYRVDGVKDGRVHHIATCPLEVDAYAFAEMQRLARGPKWAVIVVAQPDRIGEAHRPDPPRVAPQPWPQPPDDRNADGDGTPVPAGVDGYHPTPPGRKGRTR